MNLYLWIILMVPLAAMARGLALSVLWSWFVVPFGIMKISMAQALGIALTLQCAVTDLPKFECKDPISQMPIALLLTMISYIALGACLYHFM